MAYAIIQPPYTLKFREMSKPELKGYYAWYMQVLPERLTGLEAVVRDSPAYVSWRADLSPGSLVPLGHWFASQVETRARTQEELDELKSRLSFPIDLPGEDLTNRTFSLAMDVGMYLSQVMFKNLPGMKWDQPLKSKNFVDYGQPVITGFGKVSLNPVQIVVVLAYGVADQTRDGTRLKELYEIWAKMAK